MQTPTSFPRTFSLAIPLLLSLAVSGAAQVDPSPAPAPMPAPAPASQDSGLKPQASPSTTTTTAPATAPTIITPPTRPFTTTRPATTLSTKVKFNFKDAPIASILEYLASSFGFIVVTDPDVRITGRVTISSPNDVTADEAIESLDSVLKTQGGGSGYGVVRTDKVLHVMTRDKIKGSAPVFVGAVSTDIPSTDAIRTQVIPLRNIDAVRLRQDLSSMFSAEADVSANAASNTLVITDTSARIHRLVEIIAAMDTQTVLASDLKVFKLQYANAAAAAKLITDIFSPDSAQNTQNTRGGGRGGFGQFGGFRGAPGGQATPAADTARTGKVTASSDDRTNTVVVTAPTETLKAIEIVVKQIDADPTLETSFFVYPLKNANAANLQNVLNGLFGNATTGSTASTSRTSGFQPFAQSASSSSSSGSRSTGSGFGSSSQTTGRTGSTSNTGRNTGSSSSSSRNAAGNDLAGQAFVVAEPDTNSLLVTAKTSYAAKVRDLITQLDRDVPQVLIKVLICEVTHTNSSDIGVEYSVLNQRPVQIVNPDGTIGTTQGGSTAGTNFGIDGAIGALAANGSAGGLVATVVEKNLAAALRALATTGKLDVLSRPSILASDNQLASIMVGQSIPIITSSNITSVGNIVNSVTYKDVGIILNVTPHINPDGLVILDVAPTISQLSAQTVTVQAGVNVPVIDQRQAQTRVAIRNGQTIIIGGLMQDQKSETVNKIPLLGDIPWLGQLFSHTIQSKTKTELLVFLTPQVAQNPDLLPGMSNDERAGTQLVPNAVAPGTFDEHMQGMARGAAKQRPNANAPFPVIPITPPHPIAPGSDLPDSYHAPAPIAPSPEGEAPTPDGPSTPAPAQEGSND